MEEKKDLYKDMNRDKLIYELERYKKAVCTRDIMIEGMRGEMHGQEQIVQILYAFIYVLADENEKVISSKEIREALGKYTVEIVSGEDDTFKIKVVKNGKQEKTE